MPWTAVPYDNEDSRVELNEHFGVEGFPTLIIVDPKTGRVINSEGRQAVVSDEACQDFPWKVKPFNPLTGNRLNTDACFMILYNGPADAALNTSVQAMATKFHQKFEDANLTSHPVYFFYGEGSPVEAQVRKILQLGDQKPLMLIMSIPDQAKYISSAKTAEEATQFVQDFIDGKLTPSPLGK